MFALEQLQHLAAASEMGLRQFENTPIDLQRDVDERYPTSSGSVFGYKAPLQDQQLPGNKMSVPSERNLKIAFALLSPNSYSGLAKKYNMTKDTLRRVGLVTLRYAAKQLDKPIQLESISDARSNHAVALREVLTEELGQYELAKDGIRDRENRLRQLTAAVNTMQKKLKQISLQAEYFDNGLQTLAEVQPSILAMLAEMDYTLLTCLHDLKNPKR